jgi:hypothetical protein
MAEPTYLQKLSQVESSNNRDAVNKTTMAMGLYQFTPKTQELLEEKYPELKGFDPFDVDDAQRAASLLTNENVTALERENISATDQNKYVMHFMGNASGRRLIKAAVDDNLKDQPASTVFAREARDNPAIFNNKTVAEVYASLGDRINSVTEINPIRSAPTVDVTTPTPKPKKPDPDKNLEAEKNTSTQMDQMLDQDGPIADTGDVEVEMEEEDKSVFDSIKDFLGFGDNDPVQHSKQELTDLIKNYAQGGMTMRTPSMPQQMNMFDEGGLLDEGGTIDPVSGNDVPSGSLQQEVRDDIPAQLSEGEFVFPADVVRYWGLETLMNMRQEAKAGLKRMEDMGQMGNSEEATLPDDIPFDLNDLELGDDSLQLQEGGMVPSNVSFDPRQGLQVNQMAPSQFYQPPAYAQRPIYQTDYVAPEVPTFETPDVLPEFEDLIPAEDGYDELVEYYNPETNEVRMIPFVNGQPIYPIPTGFIKREEAAVEAPEVDPVEAPSVQDTSDGDDESVPRFGYSITTGERVRVGNLTPQEILEGVQDKKDRFSITGSRGMSIPIPGIGTIATLLGADLPKFGEKEPANISDAPPGYQREINERRAMFEDVLGTEISGYVGFQKGDLSVTTGGVFDSRGRAVNEDGSGATTANGTRAYASFKDWTNDMKAGRESGWRGGPINEKTYNKLSETGKARYDKYADITGAKSHKPEPEPTPAPPSSRPTAPSPASPSGGGSPDSGGGSGGGGGGYSSPDIGPGDPGFGGGGGGGGYSSPDSGGGGGGGGYSSPDSGGGGGGGFASPGMRRAEGGLVSKKSKPKKRKPTTGLAGRFE